MQQINKKGRRITPPAFTAFQLFSLLPFGSFFRQFYPLGLVSSGLFQRTGFPAVQVMGDIVAITALGEAGQHTCRVRCTMATLARRDRLMLVFMTGNAVDTFMLGIGLAVQLESLLVA